MKPAPLISAVIATRNRPDSLRRMVASLRRQSYTPIQVIVVDDGSDPALPALGDGVALLRNDHNLGACRARNQGIGAADGDFIGFFDDDAELVDADCFSRAVDLANRYPESGVIGFRQCRPGGAEHYMQPVNSPSACYAPRFFSYGAMLRTATIREVGGFDECLGFYHEEIELSLRMLDAGWRIIYDPSLSLIHHEDPRGRDPRMLYRRMLRNMTLTALLRYPARYVAAGVAQALARHARWTRSFGGIDWQGMGWAARQVSAATPYVRRNRRAVKAATLWNVRRLSRQPAPLRALDSHPLHSVRSVSVHGES